MHSVRVIVSTVINKEVEKLKRSGRGGLRPEEVIEILEKAHQDIASEVTILAQALIG